MAGREQTTGHRSPVTGHRSLVTGHWSLVTLLLLSGCGSMPFQTQQTYYGDQSGLFSTNYATFEHPFTDAAAEDVHRRAQSQCAQRKLVAVKTTSRCTLERCTTRFQCMEPDETAGGKP